MKPQLKSLPIELVTASDDLQMRANIDGFVVAEYRELADELPPVEVVYDGSRYWLFDGFHRYSAFRLAGRKEIPALVLEGTRDDALWLAVAANQRHGVRRSNADKRRAVRAALEARPEMSDRALARHVGVDDHTVARERRLLEVSRPGADFRTSTRRVGLDGKEYRLPAVGGTTEQRWAEAEAPFSRIERPRPAAGLPPPPPEPDEPEEVAREPLSAREALTSSASVEWYTPPEITAAAREVMGGIGLDPASCEAANAHVGAARYFAREDDGLSQPWSGAVWLNPPYGRTPNGRSSQDVWLERLFAEHAAGRVKEACALVNVATADGWWQRLWDVPLCFIVGRVRFIGEDGQPGPSPTHSSVVAYLGPNQKRFADIFSRLGRIVLPTTATSSFALRSKHLGLCGTCGVPCSTGRYCPDCKQYERVDRRWMRRALELARAELAAGRAPSPPRIAATVGRSWSRDVVPLLVRHQIGTEQQRKQWQHEAYLARKG